MNKAFFIFTESTLKLFDNECKKLSYDIFSRSTTRHGTEKWKVELTSLGGRQTELQEFVSNLESIGIFQS